MLHPERPKRDLQEVRGRHERNTRSRRSSLEFLSAERHRAENEEGEMSYGHWGILLRERSTLRTTRGSPRSLARHLVEFEFPG